MNKTMQYFPDEDILHVLIRPGRNPDGLLLGPAAGEGDEAGSVELSPHITAELDKDGELIGVEITDATAYVRDNILESVQGRLLTGPSGPGAKGLLDPR